MDFFYEKIHHDYADEFECNIACLIEKVKIMKTKKGDMMALINVRDYSGAIEMAVFPKTFEKIKNKIKLDTICIAKGKVASRNGEKTFVVDNISELI